jgi:chloramphenicol O-acetyltransferase type A
MDHFERINMETWPRAGIYKLYTEGWGTVTYSLTKKLSVAKLVPYLKENGIKFVPAVMWLVSREINRIENFRLSVRDGDLGRWAVIHPMFPTLNANEDMTFHGLRHTEDFREFYESYLKEQAENREKTCLWANRIPPNFFMVSIFPWLHFDASSMQLHNAKEYFAPFIAIGQYNEEMELPCMLMGNHAATDAWHVAQFFSRLQEGFDDPSQWCK